MLRSRSCTPTASAREPAAWKLPPHGNPSHPSRSREVTHGWRRTLPRRSQARLRSSIRGAVPTTTSQAQRHGPLLRNGVQTVSSLTLAPCRQCKVRPQAPARCLPIPGSDLNLQRKVGRSLEFAVGGTNLLTPRHFEFASGTTFVVPAEVPRSAFIKATWTF